MDLIMDLPTADGFDSIFVMVDQGLSKGVILLPCNKTITSEDTARRGLSRDPPDLSGSAQIWSDPSGFQSDFF